MQKKVSIVIIACMVLILCGYGIIQLSQKGFTKLDVEYESEMATQYDITTEVEAGTEIELGTELGTEVETTEVVSETEEEKNTEANTQTTTNSEEKETPKAETSKEEAPKQETTKEDSVKEETPKVEIPKVETPKEETPTVETPKVESSESESASATTTPARGAYLVKGQDLSSASLSVGDGMYDITVTTVDRITVTLSELLKEKDMVMLNFWFIRCPYCDLEFPYMSDAYEMYKDDIEIIALDIDGYDSQAAIDEYRKSKPLPFKVAQASISWAHAFGISGYPTSVIIDRYGVVCAIESGAILTVEGFTSIFERYIGDDYQPAY